MQPLEVLFTHWYQLSIYGSETSKLNTNQEAVRQERDCEPSDKCLCSTPIPHLWLLLQCIRNHASGKVRWLGPRPPLLCRGRIVNLTLHTLVEGICMKN